MFYKNVATMFIVAPLLVSLPLLAEHPCCTEKPNGCQGPVLCHTDPDIDSNRWHVDLGFILEQARPSDMAYARSMKGTSVALPQAYNSVYDQSFGLDFGVTCAIGYDFESDHWSTNLRFDWLSTTGTGSVGSSNGYNINGLNFDIGYFLNNSFGNSYATAASSTYNINYYNLMFDLGRGAYMTECVVIDPHVGLKFSFIYQSVVNQFSGGSIAAGGVITETSHLDLWGIGPSFGLDTNWNLGESVSLFFDTNLALLLASAKGGSYVVYSASPSTNVQGLDGASTPYITPSIRTILGLMYEKKFYCDEQMVRGRIGLDTSMYWNEGTLIVGGGYSALNPYNSFSLTGLILELCWCF